MNIEDTFHSIFLDKYPWPDFNTIKKLKADSDPLIVENAKKIEKLVKFVNDWVWEFQDTQKWAQVKADLHAKLARENPWYSESMKSKVETYASWYGWREGIFRSE